MDLPNEIDNCIKEYLFHKIGIHGKHLKVDDPNIVLFNKVVNEIPSLSSSWKDDSHHLNFSTKLRRRYAKVKWCSNGKERFNPLTIVSYIEEPWVKFEKDRDRNVKRIRRGLDRLSC